MEAVSSAGSCLFTTLGVLPGPLVATPENGWGRAAAILFGRSGRVIRLLRVLPKDLLRIPMPLIPHIRAIELSTGVKYGFGGFWEVGERAYNLERSLQSRFGVDSAADVLPRRLTHEPMDVGDASSVVPLESLKRDYYRQRGWNGNGLPEDALMARLKTGGRAPRTGR